MRQPPIDAVRILVVAQIGPVASRRVAGREAGERRMRIRGRYDARVVHALFTLAGPAFNRRDATPGLKMVVACDRRGRGRGPRADS